MLKPQKIDDVNLAFPTSIEGFLPKREDIPAEFKGNVNPYAEKISEWFFKGVDRADFVVKDGIDAEDALRHISYCLNSFEPSHGHKTAGCAYLLSLWFDLAVPNG